MLKQSRATVREKTKYFAFYNIIAPKISFVNYRGKFLAYCTIYLVENGKLRLESYPLTAIAELSQRGSLFVHQIPFAVAVRAGDS